MFGPSKTDQSQDKQLAEILKTQIYLNKHIDALWTWINYFKPIIKDLQKRVSEGEKLDAQQEAAIDGLKKIGLAIQQAEKETAKNEH